MAIRYLDHLTGKLFPKICMFSGKACCGVGSSAGEGKVDCFVNRVSAR